MKNKFFCLSPAPLLLMLLLPIGLISLLFIIGSFIFLIVKQKRNKKNAKGIDSKFWKLSIMMLAYIAFIASLIKFHADDNYLLTYSLTFAVLFVGYLFLKIYSRAEIKKITIIIFGLLLLIFIALYFLKVINLKFDGPPTSTGVFVKGFQPPSTTTGFSNPIGGCGEMTIF
jgi:hypothetical protein